ncbi:MAG: UDP-N-acetylmuramoyl-tripeptide--D-alanyl-D-alanine ligase [Chlorobi bacterium]|nr:UDP-N-acetylmuramoyl-tripeptide--D-alanyl-D-alanine ligase [Chlorobiota bacterium]MCI0715063.1 UDP-N-acetylmuramoyl-tripeptide--D-alanyl-D-alanine ligase [Chlorobiota bacterium]
MDLGLEDLRRLKNAEIINSGIIERVKFSGVSIDSRKCKAGDLFFPIKGERFNGHDFVAEVIKKGCKCAVVNKNWFKRFRNKNNRSLKKTAFVLTDDTVKTLGEAANIYRRKFIIPFIAIGGSNGKTSAKDFIGYVLSKKYKVLKTEGNLNNELGVPLTLFKLNKSHEIAVIEVGMNHFGEIERLCRIVMPQFGLVTNIGKEHLEFVKSLHGAAKAEGELVEHLKEIYGMFFLNADDKYLSGMVEKDKLNMFSYATNAKADVKGRVRKFKGFFPEVEIKYGSKIIRTVLNTIGYQSFQAALSAAAVGFYFEVPAGVIKKAISEYKLESSKRNQLINSKGVWIIDDTYNSNPDSVIAALENLNAYKVKGKKHIVLGDMLELGKQSKAEHRNIGQKAWKMNFENLYTYGEDSYQTYLGAKRVRNNYHFLDKETLSEFLKVTLKKGDVVLVKGSRGMKMEEIIESLSKN